MEHRVLVEERNAQVCRRMNEPIDRCEAVIRAETAREVMNFQFWKFIFPCILNGMIGVLFHVSERERESYAVAIDVKISEYKQEIWLVLWREREKILLVVSMEDRVKENAEKYRNICKFYQKNTK